MVARRFPKPIHHRQPKPIRRYALSDYDIDVFRVNFTQQAKQVLRDGYQVGAAAKRFDYVGVVGGLGFVCGEYTDFFAFSFAGFCELLDFSFNG